MQLLLITHRNLSLERLDQFVTGFDRHPVRDRDLALACLIYPGVPGRDPRPGPGGILSSVRGRGAGHLQAMHYSANPSPGTPPMLREPEPEWPPASYPNAPSVAAGFFAREPRSK